MGNLKVADEEYQDFANAVEKHGQGAREDMESFLMALEAIQKVAVKEGRFSENHRLFADQVRLTKYKMNTYGSDLAAKLRAYVEEVDSADKELY